MRTSPSSSCASPTPLLHLGLPYNLSHSSRYQFNSDLYNPDVVMNILIKALTALPFPDFNLCISLLDERPGNTNPDEPDPLPSLLPVLTSLHNLLQQCRFPAFWTLYRSEKAESLRDNYTVECAGFEDSVREVVVRGVKAAFQRIGSQRLGSYLDLSGMLLQPLSRRGKELMDLPGDDLAAFVTKLGWTFDAATGVVSIPPNPDNQIVSTVVQENIQLPRKSKIFPNVTMYQLISSTELLKVISHAQTA